MTQYPENVVFSINMLITKNKELIAEMRTLLQGIAAADIDLENYLVKTQFGNKVVPVSIVSPKIAAITLDEISSLYARIRENNAAIRAMSAEQELFELNSEDVLALSIKFPGIIYSGITFWKDSEIWDDTADWID